MLPFSFFFFFIIKFFFWHDFEFEKSKGDASLILARSENDQIVGILYHHGQNSGGRAFLERAHLTTLLSTFTL